MKKNTAPVAEIAAVQLSTEEYLNKVVFCEDDFEFINKDNFDLIDSNFANQGYWKDAMVRFLNKKSAVVSMIFIIFIIIMAIVGPGMSGHSFSQQNITNQNMAPRIPALENMGIFNGSEDLKTSTGIKKTNKYMQGDNQNVYYWFGSDSLGRDIWTRTWTGTRISLYIAMVAVLIDMIFGLSYGLISGYFGGRVDMIMQRIVEIVNSIPTLVIVTLLIIVLSPGLVSITFALMVSGWIGMSRIARAEILKLKEQEYVLASRTLGAKSFRLIFVEILPNIFGQLITQSMFSIPHAIFTEAFLAFIGLGVPAPMASLGSMIADGYQNIMIHPYMICAPLIVMAVLMLSFTLLADGLRDALDPKMKEM